MKITRYPDGENKKPDNTTDQTVSDTPTVNPPQSSEDSLPEIPGSHDEFVATPGNGNKPQQHNNPAAESNADKFRELTDEEERPEKISIGKALFGKKEKSVKTNKRAFNKTLAVQVLVAIFGVWALLTVFRAPDKESDSVASVVDQDVIAATDGSAASPVPEKELSNYQKDRAKREAAKAEEAKAAEEARLAREKELAEIEEKREKNRIAREEAIAEDKRKQECRRQAVAAAKEAKIAAAKAEQEAQANNVSNDVVTIDLDPTDAELALMTRAERIEAVKAMKARKKAAREARVQALKDEQEKVRLERATAAADSGNDECNDA